MESPCRGWVINKKRGFKKTQFLAGQPPNSENTTWVARQKKNFRGYWAILGFLNSLQRGVFEHKNSRASCQLVSSQRRATRLEVSFVTGVATALSHVLWGVLWWNHQIDSVRYYCMRLVFVKQTYAFYYTLCSATAWFLLSWAVHSGYVIREIARALPACPNPSHQLWQTRLAVYGGQQDISTNEDATIACPQGAPCTAVL